MAEHNDGLVSKALAKGHVVSSDEIPFRRILKRKNPQFPFPTCALTARVHVNGISNVQQSKPSHLADVSHCRGLDNGWYRIK